MIDTGSEATLLKASSQSKVVLPCCHRPSRQLSGVSGAALQVLGEYDLNFSLSPTKAFVHRVVLTAGIEFPADILLGMDVLRRFSYQLVDDRRKETAWLALDDHFFPIRYCSSPSLHIQVVRRTCQVSNICEGLPKLLPEFGNVQEECNCHVPRTTVVPAHAARFIKVRTPTGLSKAADILVTSALQQVLVPRSIVTSTEGYLPVWVVNPSNRPVKLRCGTLLAVLHDVSEEEDIGGSGKATCAIYSNMPNTVSSPGNTSNSEHLPSLSHLKAPDRRRYQQLLQEFPQLFSGDPMECGEVPGVTHKIQTGDAAPTVTRQWRLPHSSRQTIRDQCDRMAKAGVIEPASSPWLSPVVLVRKKSGEVRFCVDFRRINALTTGDSYPLPPIQTMLDDLHASKVFTSLDARSAYWSIPVEPSDRPKTAFSDGARLFQFTRMPYGLKTAPQTFQRTINLVLSSVLGRHTAAYLDDVVIFSEDMDSHLLHLRETLTLLHRAGFRLNPEKCDVAVEEFKFLGFVVSAHGIRPDPEKTRAIAEMERPKDARGVRRFLGCVGFFRRHIAKFAEIAASLTNLTRKDASFKWTEDHQQAFEGLKGKLLTAPVLLNPDYSQEFQVHTDASKVAVGGCLMQKDKEGRLHAIAYYSRKMKGAETRYSATDSEALAVVESVRAFDPYLYGRKFTVFTDHRPLLYIFKRLTKSPRMSRWGLELQTYDYTIQYQPGSTHKVPDMLSRTPTAAVAPVSLDNVEPTVLRQEQLKDPIWAEVMTHLEGGSIPKARLPAALDEFEVSNGILYHVKALADRLLRRVVVPCQLQQSALRLAHASPLAAHPGIFRTYTKLKTMFFFPNMLSRVKKYLKQCNTCQFHKGYATRNATLAAAPEVSRPLEKVSADLITLPLSSRRYRYVLVLVDNLSRYVELVPLRDRTAKTVATAIIDKFVTVYGPPQALQTDGGGEFDNDLLHEVCQALKTDFSLTLPYNPMSNGMVERTNRVVKEALTSLCARSPSKWDEALPQVRFALNTSVHRSVMEQPLYLFQGHHVDMPVGLTKRPIYSDDTPPILQERLSLAWDAAKDATRAARQVWSHDYNKKVKRNLELKEGTLVLLKTAVRSNALSPRWYGPARIVKKLGPVSFLVQELYADAPEKKIHVNQLKIFRTTDELTTPQDDVSQECEDPDDQRDSMSIALLACLNL